MEPFVIKALIALVPVIVCLTVFERLDAFKLVNLTEIVALLLAGGALTVISYFANGGVLDEFPVGFDDYARYVAPAVEEFMKAALIVGLFAFNRIGYMIDAAIAGFTIGAGFALAENIFYLREFTSADLGVWIVRGFGTALMHGGAAAMMSVLSLVLYARRLRADASSFRLNLLLFTPGLAVAILLHMAFNHFPEEPLIAMMVALVATPLGLLGLFAIGESYAHRWLAEDSRAHQALLDTMRDGSFLIHAGWSGAGGSKPATVGPGGGGPAWLCEIERGTGGPCRNDAPGDRGAPSPGPRRRSAREIPASS